MTEIDLNAIGRVDYEDGTYGYTNVLGWNYSPEEQGEHIESDWPTRRVAELLEEFYDSPALYQTDTTRARVWTDRTLPKPGESWSVPWALEEQRPTLADQVINGQYSKRETELRASLLDGTYDAEEDGSVWLEVPHTTYGDYVGDTVTRSNQEVLLEEYPETFYVVSGGYSSSTLMLRVDGQRITEELFDRLAGLNNYPLLDEQQHSEVEERLANEMWGTFGRDEFKTELSKALSTILELDVDDVEEWEAWPDDDAIDAWFWDHNREYPKDVEAPSGNPIWDSEDAYVCEDAVSAYFPHLDTAAELYATYLERNWGKL